MKGSYVIFMLFAVIVLCIPGTLGTTIIYDSSLYTCVQVYDVSNIRYINDYKYRVFENNTFLADFGKGECIPIKDNSTYQIKTLGSTTQSLKSNNFVTVLSVGFFAFMQYGIYILLVILFIAWFIRRRH